MSKNIVFCADGTWNGPGEPDRDDKTAAPTNVFKLFFNLDGRDTPDTSLLEKEQERVLTNADGTTQQHALTFSARFQSRGALPCPDSVV
jgi:hypothetical protein